MLHGLLVSYIFFLKHRPYDSTINSNFKFYNDSHIHDTIKPNSNILVYPSSHSNEQQAGGNLGPSVLDALVKQFTVTILTRKSSKSTFPSSIKTISVSDDYPEAEVLEAFKGQDAVVSTVGGAAEKSQLSLIDFAVKAGVKRFIPAEYGSNTTNPELTKRLFIFQEKVATVEHLKKQESKGLTWSAIVTGPFLDW